MRVQVIGFVIWCQQPATWYRIQTVDVCVQLSRRRDQSTHFVTDWLVNEHLQPFCHRRQLHDLSRAKNDMYIQYHIILIYYLTRKLNLKLQIQISFRTNVHYRREFWKRHKAEV